MKVWRCEECAPTPACVLTCYEDDMQIDPSHCPWLGEHKANWSEMRCIEYKGLKGVIKE